MRWISSRPTSTSRTWIWTRRTTRAPSSTRVCPHPINSPGEKALEAALEPDKGDWLYYATVNLDTGETKFTDNYDEFLRFQEELREWEAANPQ